MPAAGLDAPIMNPYDEAMQNALMASAALLGKDPNGLAFSKNEVNLTVPKKAATANCRISAPWRQSNKQSSMEKKKLLSNL